METLTEQANRFLIKHKFPADAAHRKLFASYVQMIPGHKDYFYPSEAAAFMRKCIANESAFFVMNPKKYDEYLALKAEEEKKANESPAEIKSTVG